jgi:hypothetical protein
VTWARFYGSFSGQILSIKFKRGRM